MVIEVIQQVAFINFLKKIEVVEDENDDKSEETGPGNTISGQNFEPALQLTNRNMRLESCLGCVPGCSTQNEGPREDPIHSLTVLLEHLKEHTESRCEMDSVIQVFKVWRNNVYNRC
ncbi:unnamed protein product [Allacma fusca]|uniref:Uncharacterized protein n=1 Tax=Allacma fusca TaxID=39272 RepID=A0A8J2NLF0_9HEXA|nr:unnamed protein product [Allacma fusca]